jgi:hypothetical protein
MPWPLKAMAMVLPTSAIDPAAIFLFNSYFTIQNLLSKLTAITPSFLFSFWCFHFANSFKGTSKIAHLVPASQG